MNTFAFGSASAGSINVCSFDVSLSLSTGVTGNYFEGQGSPSPWTGPDVEVQIFNQASNLKTKHRGAMRVVGCRLNLKDIKLEPPIMIAQSLMQSGWKETGIPKSLLFTSHDGSQIVKITDRGSDTRDDTWPFFCQVCCSPFFLSY